MAIPISDTPHAPFIFYENVPAFGFTNGIINLTLSANRTWLGSARLGSARRGSARLGSARLGSARLGSAGSARLGRRRCE